MTMDDRDQKFGIPYSKKGRTKHINERRANTKNIKEGSQKRRVQQHQRNCGQPFRLDIPSGSVIESNVCI